MSSGSKLPVRSVVYDVYRMRLAQIKILQARGFLIPESFQYLLSPSTVDAEKFQQFSAIWQAAPPQEATVYYYYDIFVNSGGASLDAFLCDIKHVDTIIVEMNRRVIVASASPNAFLNLQIITTEEYKNDATYRGANIEVIPYHRIFCDPTSHRRAAAAYQVLTDEERKALLGSEKMRGATFTHMSPLDSLSLYLGIDKGDAVRLWSNSTSGGLTTSRVLYRQVIEDK